MTKREEIPIYDIKGNAIDCAKERETLEQIIENRIDRYITKHLVFERRSIGEVMRAIYMQGVVIGADVENMRLEKKNS